MYQFTLEDIELIHKWYFDLREIAPWYPNDKDWELIGRIDLIRDQMAENVGE